MTGGALWVGGVTLGGLPVRQHARGSRNNLDKIIWAAILIPGLIVIFGAWRARRKAALTRAS